MFFLMFINAIYAVVNWWKRRQQKKFEDEKHAEEMKLFALLYLQTRLDNYPRKSVVVPKRWMKMIDEGKFSSFHTTMFKASFESVRTSFDVNEEKKWNHENDVFFELI